MTREQRRARRDVMAPKPKRHLSYQVVIRVTPELNEIIRADAKAHGRTVAQSARFHLEVALGLRDAESR